MNNKGALGWFANESLMHQRGKESFEREKQVGEKFKIGVLLLINE